MINPLHLQRQFLSSSTTIIGGGTQSNKPFNPPKEKPKTAKIYLNSTDKMSGTNNEATFKVNLPTEFTTQDLGLTLINFIPVVPTGTDEGIVQVNLVGVNNPYTYSSSNQTTHRSLGMFEIQREGRPREYPPSALTGTTTTLSGQAYGNGTYIVGGNFQDTPWNVFDKNSTTIARANTGYTFSTGLPTGDSIITATNGSNYSGRRLTLTLPSAIQLTSYSVQVWSDSPKNPTQWTLLGSRDSGSNWDWVHSHPYTNNSAFQVISYSLPSNTLPYRTYGVVVERVGQSFQGASRDFAQPAEIRLFGYSNPQLEYITTTTTSFNGTTSPANAFDYDSNTAWTTGTAYTASTGAYTGCNFTTVDGSNMMGEWIELQTPESIILQSYILAGDSNYENSSPRNFTLVASSNGTTYTQIHTFSSFPVLGRIAATNISFNNLPTTIPYNRFRLLTHGVGADDFATSRTYAGIAEWRLTGYSNVANVGNLNEWFNIPPVGMAGNTQTITGQTAGNGTYIASSSFQSSQSFQLFDKLGPNLTSPNSYDDATGWYNSNTTTPVLISGTTSNMGGEWVQINTPCPITVAQLDLSSYNDAQTRCPSTISLVGANTNGVFNHIFTMCNLTNWGTGTDSTNRWYRTIYASGGSAPYSFNQTAFPTNFYQNWRLIVHRVGNSSSNASGRNYLNLSEMLLRGYASNNPYNVPPSVMTATSTTFSNQLFGNGTYTTTSSSNIITTITSNNIPPAGRIGQSNLNAEIITTDRTLFHRPITLRLSSPTGMDLSTMCNWSAELTITERP